MYNSHFCLLNKKRLQNLIINEVFIFLQPKFFFSPIVAFFQKKKLLGSKI